MVRRCQMSIPRETWVYLTILAIVVVGAVLREINLLIILSGLLFGPLWISWHLIRATLRKVQISRRLPRTVFPGELFDVELRVRNTRRRLDCWALVVEDRIRHVHSKLGVSTKSARALMPHIPAGGQCTASYRCRLWERGRYRLGPARISTQIPVGLLRGHLAFRKTNELLVYPQLGKLTAKWSVLVKVDRLGQRSCHRNQGPIEGDFYGLRDWRSGDSRRWIHWRSSAKRNQLVVRQFEQFRTQDFVILLDLWPNPDQESSDAQAAIERAISFVATVVAEHCHHGSGHIKVGVAAETVRMLKGSAGAALLNETLEVLADARTPQQDRLAELMTELPPKLSREDQVVIVTTHHSNPISSGRAPLSQQESTACRDRLLQALSIDVTDPDFDDMFVSENLSEVT